MSSHFARLKEQLDAKQHELQEQQATIESIEKLTRELETQKKALAAKATELDVQQNEVRVMQSRLEALTAAEPAINNAMRTRSSTQDVLKHVIERAIQSDHMTGSEISQTVLDTAIGVNGRTRSDNLGDFLIDLIVDEGSAEAAIEAAMENTDIRHVVKHTLAASIAKGVGPVHLTNFIKKTMDAMVDEKPGVMDNWGAEPPTVKLPPVRQPTTTPVNTNGLRGQAADFKPLKETQQTYSATGWQALAQSGWGNGTGGW